MLRGIDPVLGPDLLAILRAMGHGDEIVVADANFPAAANARRLVRADGIDAVRLVRAIAALMPLDDFVPAAAFRMAVVDAPDEVPPITAAFAAALAEGGYTGPIEAVERHAFYVRAREAFAIVASGETRLYGNLILKKGVVRPGPDMRIDAHQHFWRLARGDYGWLTAELAPIHRDHEPADLEPLLKAAGIDRTVLVQAAPTDAETDFLLRLAETTDFVAGVVGWVDFEAPDATHRIAALAAREKLVGLRPMIQDISDPRWMLNEAIEPAVEAMADEGLTFDALIKPLHLPILREFAGRHPGLDIVIDHAAKPDIAGGALADWARDIRTLAAETRLVCKLSGLVTEAAPGWSVETLRPYVDVLVEVFGADRLMWGSDWPVLNLNGGYSAWMAAAETLLGDLSEAEREAIFGGTASVFYGLDHE